LVTLVDAFRQEDDRVFLALHPNVAAYKAAIFPLMKKPELMEAAERIHKEASKKYRVTFDESGSIGKRYYRQDEIGTPFCITIDFDTVEKQTLTVRHRDTKQQDRVDVSRVMEYLSDQLAGWTLKV
jgi:glycyl-tRNA synthetase